MTRSKFMTVPSFEQAMQLLNDRVNLEHLQSFSPQAMEGRLDTLQQILDSLGNPETAYPTVHITGTKGKGSTCMMLESMLRQEGCRVGRFTSPHIDSFTERLSIDGVPCPADEFAELFFFVFKQIEPSVFQTLTYFELLTLLAFVYFSQRNVDIALFEVGLGGRLDATNLCKPHISIITSISFDHMQQLGNTLTSIAAEKSGIIKPHIPVVTTVQHPEPLQMIRGKARDLDAPLYALDHDFFVQQNGNTSSTFRYETKPEHFPHAFSLDNLVLSMPGAHQIRNAAAALSAFLLLHPREHRFDVQQIHEGLRQAFLPLRGEQIRLSEECPTLFFDGAHNRASMKTLIQTVLELYPHRRLWLILGVSQGKDVEGMVAEIADHFDRIILTQSSHTRRLPPQELQQMFSLHHRTAHLAIIENAPLALEHCLQQAETSDVVCISGSLYLAAELRRLVLSRT